MVSNAVLRSSNRSTEIEFESKVSTVSFTTLVRAAFFGGMTGSES